MKVKRYVIKQTDKTVIALICHEILIKTVQTNAKSYHQKAENR